MPVRGIDLGNLVGQYRSPYKGDMGGGIAPALQFMAEQDRLKQSAAAQQDLLKQQELRLMNQAGLQDKFRMEQLAAKKALALSAQEASDKREREKREDEAFGSLYKAIGSGNQDEVKARVQELGRLGYTVESPGAEEGKANGGSNEQAKAPGGTEEQNSWAGDGPVPEGQQGQDAVLRGQPQGPQTAELKPDQEAKTKEWLGGMLGGGEAPLRPAPARSLIEHPGEAALVGGSQDVAESQAPDDIASGAAFENEAQAKEQLPPARMEQPEKLPPAKTEKPFRGYRVRDESGKVVFEFDPASAFGQKQKGGGTLDALSRIQARDAEEERAKGMAYGMAHDFIANGVPDAEAWKRASEAYRFELTRLGKVRRTGQSGGSPPSPSGLSQKEKNNRDTQVRQWVAQDGRFQGVQKLEDELRASETATANLNGKAGFAQLNGYVHILKSAQGGRVTDADKRQADQALGKINQIKNTISQYASSDAPMPPEAIENIREAQRLTEQYMRERKKRVALQVGKSIATNPNIQYKDDADRARQGAWVVRDLTGELVDPESILKGDDESPAQAKPQAKKQLSPQQRANALLGKK